MIQIFSAIVFIPLSSLLFYNNISQKNFNKVNFRYAIFVFFMLFIISGLRHVDIGNDSIAYSESFNDLYISNSFWDLDGRFEPGYQYLSKFIKIYVSAETPALFIITSFLIQFFCVWFMYHNSKKLWLSIFLFITLRYFFFSVSAVRQGLALGLCLFAYEYLKRNKIKHFFIYVFLASSFHFSALIFLVFPLFKNLKFTIKKALVIGLIASLVFAVLSQVLTYVVPTISYGGDYLEQGVTDDFTSRLGAILIALFTLVGILFALYFKYHKSESEVGMRRYELWGVFFSFIIGVLAIKFGILMRFTYYFAMFSVILIPNVIASIRDITIKKIVIPFWVIITLVYIMTILYMRPEWYNFYPYKFFWQ